MWTWFHRLGSPPYFYEWAGRWAPRIGVLAALLFAWGLYDGLVLAPTDYKQGESYRIIFIHVPAAWMSMMVYVTMAVSAAIGLIWRMKVAEVMARAAAPLGAWFTVLALVTGSLWGKPMWGTWWVWDARLTSELLLLFLYLGYIALNAAIEEPRQAARASAVLAVVGVVNIPIIHFSVEWWNTLHQGPTVTRLDAPAINIAMFLPLITMALAFMAYFAAVWLMRARGELLERERRSRWVQRVVAEESG
ncbi:Heme exporter protein C [wastewater metagenome]|uniref:Heme exporter protein C n=2 Tax=unclassified sequences TaxID=12908 RepID=A0A5B8R845_9ZZZZ|nr:MULTISPECIES: heme ABC transporter permease [Arhodomonas]MCS4504228.1 heme ABC transporter permease [Arhodomonas aquaeolei]QEA04148.1 heme exporter protein C [uncultured organism]